MCFTFRQTGLETPRFSNQKCKHTQQLLWSASALSNICILLVAQTLLQLLNVSSCIYLWQQFVNKAKRHLIFKLKVGLHERYGHPEDRGQDRVRMGNVRRVWQHAGINTVGGWRAGPWGSRYSGKAVASLSNENQCLIRNAYRIIKKLTAPSVLPVFDPELHCVEDRSTGCCTLQISWGQNRSAGDVVRTDQRTRGRGNSADLCSFCSSVCHLSWSLVRTSYRSNNTR